MQQGFGAIILLFLILIATVLVAGGFYLKSFTFPTPTPNPAITRIISPLNPQNLVVSQKTYISGEGRFTVQYPSNYLMQEVDVVSGQDVEYPQGHKYLLLSQNLGERPFTISFLYFIVPQKSASSTILDKITFNEKSDASLGKIPAAEQFSLGNLPAILYKTALAAGAKPSIIYALSGERAYKIVINYSADKIKYEDIKKEVEKILDTFKVTTTQIDDTEKARIDIWLEANNLNQYGDPKDTVYTGGTPLFDEFSGQNNDRYQYILEKHPERPWNNTPR
jgi:hypothetical protein